MLLLERLLCFDEVFVWGSATASPAARAATPGARVDASQKGNAQVMLLLSLSLSRKRDDRASAGHQLNNLVLTAPPKSH